MSGKETPHIPYDVYESPQETLVVIPLWWVNKKTVNIALKDYRLVITGDRSQYAVKDNLIPLKQECYRWPVQIVIDLPPQVYFDKIHSKLTSENILEIVIPKNILPEKIALEVEYEK